MPNFHPILSAHWARQYRIPKYPYRPIVKKYKPNTDPFANKIQTFYRPEQLEIQNRPLNRLYLIKANAPTTKGWAQKTSSAHILFSLYLCPIRSDLQKICPYPQ